MGVKASFSNLCDALKKALSNKADETEVATIVNAYGSKNLVDTSLIPNSTGGGVTRKNNGDGSITYSGTSTLTYTTYLPLMAGQNLGKGTYIFTPNPTTATTYTYQIYKNGSYWKNFAVTQPIEITEAGKYSIGLALNSKVAISNTFKPMLRYAAIKDDTYVPYAMTNRELTEKVIGVGWVTTENLRYRKTGSIIALQGTVIPSSSAMSITLGTLPEDCRPSQNINIAQAGTDTPSRQIIVQTDGNVVLLFSINCTASHTYVYNGIFMI
uniref:Receptor binding protein n=1 Tax=Siphoviridae sp. ctqzz19 TaxID=2825682 RepID=A0A8S5U2B2_9CAUD|nr:MAG TPA: receptor binding protein [Siphoviridae sp. ctqzz19]